MDRSHHLLAGCKRLACRQDFPRAGIYVENPKCFDVLLGDHRDHTNSWGEKVVLSILGVRRTNGSLELDANKVRVEGTCRDGHRIGSKVCIRARDTSRITLVRRIVEIVDRDILRKRSRLPRIHPIGYERIRRCADYDYTFPTVAHCGHYQRSVDGLIEKTRQCR